MTQAAFGYVLLAGRWVAGVESVLAAVLEEGRCAGEV